MPGILSAAESGVAGTFGRLQDECNLTLAPTSTNDSYLHSRLARAFLKTLWAWRERDEIEKLWRPFGAVSLALKTCQVNSGNFKLKPERRIAPWTETLTVEIANWF
jgi:hypothetical protein